ncbi:MAG: DUF488 domain-containing protein [Bryobacteraceae bacterium]|nr:DUF488 domain-containing protein [Bryobacteraceae bacterium]
MAHVLTIGHSNRPWTVFLSLLRAHAVARVVDVRTVPRSRYNPRFNREVLRDALAEEGVQYTHLPSLGGLRKPRADSRNTGWRNDSFRGYADYMETPQFEEALAQLIALAGSSLSAVMCAESVPWRCHRSLIADALTARGVAVDHILAESRPQRHSLAEFAHIEGGRVYYPGKQPELGFGE